MANKTAPLLPSTQHLLVQLGERLKLARLRRRLTAKQVAERAGMSQMTLRSLEAGGSGVTIGAYMAVMQVLGLEHDIDKIAAADDAGRDLQDARLLSARPRSVRLGELTATSGASVDMGTSPVRRGKSSRDTQLTPPAELEVPTSAGSDAVSSRFLADMIRTGGIGPQRRPGHKK